MTKKSNHRNSISLQVEQLEERAVPSTTATLVGSNLQIRANDGEGTGGFFLTDPGTDNNDVTVTQRGNRMTVTTVSRPDVQGLFITDPGTTKRVTFAASRVRTISFYGGAGDDFFKNFITGVRVTASGNGGNNTLESFGKHDFFDGGTGFNTVEANAGATIINAAAVQIENLPGGNPQSKNTCGPNSAWRVMHAYGGTVRLQQLIDNASENSLASKWALGTSGSTLVDAMNSLRRGLGSKTFSLKTHQGFDDLLNDVGQGRPVVAMISAPGSVTVNLAAVAGTIFGGTAGGVLGYIAGNLPAFSDYANYQLPNLHWIAVDGFDRRLQLVYFTDTDGGRYQMSFADFQHVWNWNFGVVANTFLQGMGVVQGTCIV
jgi:hypothetical protein